MTSKKTAKTSSAKKARAKGTASHRGAASVSMETPRGASTAAKPIEVKQSSDYLGNDWWSWSVWIEASAKELDQVEYVEYTLHPTFSEPLQRRTNRAANFRMDSEGWGEFNIHVEVKRREGKPVKIEHWLTLEYPAQTSRSLSSTSPPSSEDGEVRPTIFLSFGVSDLRMGNALGEALKSEGFEILKMDDSSSNLPWDRAITLTMERADLMVMLVSGGLTSWAMLEIDAAMNRKLPILPIVIGSVPALSDQLQSLSQIRLKDASDPSSIAPQVARQIKDSIKL